MAELQQTGDPRPPDPQTQTLAGLRAWLIHRAMPLWLAHGLDRASGGFHEALAHTTYACDTPFRRLRVAARQMVVFSHAHRAGVPGAAAAVEFGLAFLIRHAALPDGGYALRFDLANTPLDTTRDLYDHSFVLLAFAEAASVLPPAYLRSRALALVGFMDAQLRHPHAGYVESLPPALPRRQNPHMHLLEALLAAHAIFGDAIFLDHARTIVHLFLNRFLDAETGALPEYFDDALHPVQEDGGFITEPGHHCEWAALLHAYTRAAGTDARCDAAASALLAFANRHGVHRTTGDLIDSVAGDGTQLARTSRLWPQTERLRASHLPGQPAALKARAIASVAAYLLPDGLWHERRDSAGHFIAAPSPASSLYHLTTGILGAAAHN